MYNEEKFVFVVVHSEADYYKPLRVGDNLHVHISCERIGNTSFTVICQIFRNEKELVGIVRTVHVSLDTVTGEKIGVPERLLNVLNKYKIN